VTIADLSLIMGTVALDAMGNFDWTPFPHVYKWYKNFQSSKPELWAVAKEGLDGLTHFNKNPRDMSHLKHPLHPTGAN
jgi:glutathione S-transferase